MKLKFKLIILMLCTSFAWADPCGMVPPVNIGPIDGPAITRVGAQMTYCFYKNGVESFVIRPGFSGKIEEFGMLIPFPNPPELRKVPDNIFAHIAAAIDPPEVRLHYPKRRYKKNGASKSGLKLSRDQVKVIKEEAVGMYQVVVLEAGSARALKLWMGSHGYRYPKGMDATCEDYVKAKWCFVAVKTRVGAKKEVAPRPGLRKVNNKFPKGASFDGYVQAMGFRFRSKQFVVPMRLSAFNAGKLHNIVYILTDMPCRINSIPKKFVVRQVSGKDLYRNVTSPLPVRAYSRHISDWMIRNVERRRNPVRVNGHARDLFAADLLSALTGKLSHAHEEQEKILLKIAEELGLRGPQINKLNEEAVAKERELVVKKALAELNSMTLTVVDGEFSREVLSKENLTFSKYEMPVAQNSRQKYDAKTQGPGYTPGGQLYRGKIKKSGFSLPQQYAYLWILLAVVLTLAWLKKSQEKQAPFAVCVLLVCFVSVSFAESGIQEQIDLLADNAKAKQAVGKIVTYGTKAVPHLLGEAVEGNNIAKRGWVIVCLAKIGGQQADSGLQNIHQDGQQPKLVRTWAVAARISLTENLDQLIELSKLQYKFPAILRPLKMNIGKKLAAQESLPATKLLAIAHSVPSLQPVLAPYIIATGTENLVKIMVKSKDNNVKRLAAGYLAALKNKEQVAKAVIAAYKFDPEAESVSWNAALFVPSLGWNRNEAKELVGNFISWFLWCERNKLSAEQQQIHNNIRSLQLASQAGYQSPGWGKVGIDQWLLIWGRAFGKKEVLRILREQGVHKEGRYMRILAQLR